MESVKSAFPAPSKGRVMQEKDQFVPDQSYSLKEILARFVRHEPLPVGHATRYGSDGDIDPESPSEFNIDQEKAKYWDLAEKQEFRERVMAVREQFEAKKSDRVKKAKAEKAEADKRKYEDDVQKAAEAYVKKNPGGSPGSI